MSTAALTHGRRDLPDDAEPLGDSGYFCVVVGPRAMWNGQVSDELHFNVVSDDMRRIGTVMVTLPLDRRQLGYSWAGHGSPLTPATLNPSSGQFDDTMAARAFAETIELAAEFVDIMNDPIAEQIAAYEQAQREREQREREERERREAEYQRQREERLRLQQERAEKMAAAVASREEAIKWYIGSKFRLKRRGYRATVFGTIDDIRGQYMFTTSEKGKAMRIDMVGIYWLEVKEHEADPYETIIDEDERYDPVLGRMPEGVQ